MLGLDLIFTRKKIQQALYQIFSKSAQNHRKTTTFMALSLDFAPPTPPLYGLF